MSLFRTLKPISIKTTGGFSLIELIVTISLMTLITGIVMVKYSSFNNTVVLKSQAYEMALDIREAQVFGVSTQGNAGTYREAFGIYIDLNTPNQYLLFQDAVTSNFRYDSGEQVGELYTIDSRFVILSICTTVGAAAPNCLATNTSVSFKRPDFDAKISTTPSVTSPDRIDIQIAVANDTSTVRTVTVFPSGQISVQ